MVFSGVRPWDLSIRHEGEVKSGIEKEKTNRPRLSPLRRVLLCAKEKTMKLKTLIFLLTDLAYQEHPEDPFIWV